MNSTMAAATRINVPAHIIISEEYRHNQPVVFIHVNGQYYGDLIYVRQRECPPIDYWNTAQSSDFGRGFKVQEGELTLEQFNHIVKLDNAVRANSMMIQSATFPIIPIKWKIRAGEEYFKWLRNVEEREKKVIAEREYNEPYERARRAAEVELRNFILSL